MLQNPSKYHVNPLSHFLALHHSTQMMHNTRPAQLLPSAMSVETTNYHYHQAQQQLQHQQQQQQQQQNQQHINTYATTHLQTNPFDNANSTLDAGKSFTIAAILGLQKSAMDSNRKEYNNSAINLSMNDNSNFERNTNADEHANNNTELCSKQMNNNNNSSNNKIHRMDAINCFDNEKMVLMNRFLPLTNTTTTTTTTGNAFDATTTAIQQQQQQQQQHQHHQHQQALITSQARANSFVAVAAAAAAAAANAATNGGGAPSALQSLQKLHQHHAQQNNLSSFHRDKPKENSKRSALKNKRVRTIFTPEQLERLEAEFERQQYMVGPERLYLAHTLQLTEAQVKVWFQNRRIKWRKHHLEITHQRLALLRQSQLPANANITLENANGSIVNDSLTTEGDESNDVKYMDDIKQLGESRQASESDLSICNDSLDGDSAFDGGEDT